jgi:hypothetical protein
MVGWRWVGGMCGWQQDSTSRFGLQGTYCLLPPGFIFNSLQEFVRPAATFRANLSNSSGAIPLFIVCWANCER